MRRRFEYKHRELEDFLIRFYPAGNYTWVVPGGCFLLVEVVEVETVLAPEVDIPRPTKETI